MSTNNTKMNQQCKACERAGTECGFCAKQREMLSSGTCIKKKRNDDADSQASTTTSQRTTPASNPLITTTAPCAYCKKTGHQIAKCPELKCSYCEQQGHRKRDCAVHEQAWSWVRWARDVKQRGGWLTKQQLARVTEYKRDLGLIN